MSAIVGDRISIDDLLTELGSGVPLEDRIASADEVWISGPTLGRLLVSFADPIEHALANGTRFRFALGPSTGSVASEFTRFFGKAYALRPTEYEAMVGITEGRLEELEKKYPGLVEWTSVSNFISHNIVLTDPLKRTGTVQVHLNVCGVRTEDAPALVFNGYESESLQKLFRDEFNTLVDHASRTT